MTELKLLFHDYMARSARADLEIQLGAWMKSQPGLEQ